MGEKAMRKRIDYRVWGSDASRLGVGGSYAMKSVSESRAEAVARAIARKAGLAYRCLNAAGESPTGRDYHVMLGRERRRPGGGGCFDVHGEVWFRIVERV
jgi:hypothetical protein